MFLPGSRGHKYGHSRGPIGSFWNISALTPPLLLNILDALPPLQGGALTPNKRVRWFVSSPCLLHLCNYWKFPKRPVLFITLRLCRLCLLSWETPPISWTGQVPDPWNSSGQGSCGPLCSGSTQDSGEGRPTGRVLRWGWDTKGTEARCVGDTPGAGGSLHTGSQHLREPPGSQNPLTSHWICYFFLLPTKTFQN